MAKSMPAFRY